MAREADLGHSVHDDNRLWNSLSECATVGL
jgi:hypothetical protein